MGALLATLLGRRFWITAYVVLLGSLAWPLVAVPAGLPAAWPELRPAVPWLLGGILFFTCLKIGLGEVGSAVRDRATLGRCAWMTALKLVALPAIGWAVTRLFAPDWAAGVALVCLMPAGLTSVAFTDLHHGDRVLALFVVIATSALAPFTIPSGMALAGPGAAPAALAMLGQAGYILLLLAAPFGLAQGVRALARGFVDRHRAAWGPCAIACSMALIAVSVLANAQAWADWPPARLLWPLFFCCLAAGAALGVALLLRRWFWSHPVATVFACASLYMNNGLAVAYASKFHPGEAHVLLPALLMNIPMIGLVAIWGVLSRRDDEPVAVAA